MPYPSTTVRDQIRSRIRQGHPPCALCSGEIDYDAKPPAPLSFTVDHIVPSDAGGDHSIENAQPAHWSCNRAKSNGRKSAERRVFRTWRRLR